MLPKVLFAPNIVLFVLLKGMKNEKNPLIPPKFEICALIEEFFWENSTFSNKFWCSALLA